MVSVGVLRCQCGLYAMLASKAMFMARTRLDCDVILICRICTKGKDEQEEGGGYIFFPAPPTGMRHYVGPF